MAVIISSKNKENTFVGKEFISVGSTPGCDYFINSTVNFMLTVHVSQASDKFVVANNLATDKILFKGQPIPKKVQFEKVCKLMIANSDEFISIKLVEDPKVEKTVSSIAQEDFTESDLKGIYGKDFNTATKIKLEKRKCDIEKQRVAIVKQVAFALNDLKKRLSLNFKASLFVHIAMFLACLVLSFGVSNYLLGLPIQETANFLHLPTNIKLLFTFTVIVYGVCLILKQGVYLFLKNSVKQTSSSIFTQNFMLAVSALLVIGLYAINLVYYMQVNVVFSVFISLFFTVTTAILAIACGYFKNAGQQMSLTLDKYEYREDFEAVLNNYNQWIELYCNTISNTKLRNIKDKLFSTQIKSVGEICLGILTAPFLAFGVSNTLAMCFPEAAGWIRISGLRFSPIFLVLASFLIIFAFFAFVNAFLCIRKIQGSNVIKLDGFSNYLSHGVNLLGLEGIRKLEAEKVRSLTIAIAIIFIEFSMNVSYFMTEIGGDFKGLFLSIIAAFVPTALLIAETYMLSQTKFDIYASEELIAKIDRD